MSSKQDYAISQFHGGFNCAQAVCSAFCEKHGLDSKTALKISCGLGGGLGREKSAELFPELY